MTDDEVALLRRQLARERSAREQAEALLEEKSRELWQEREYYRILAENSSDVVHVIDAEGRVLWVSPSQPAAMGWSVEETLGPLQPDRLHPDDALPLLERLTLLRAGERVDRRVECRIRHADGSYHWWSLGARLADESDPTSNLVVAYTNVDAVVDARQRAERDEELLRATAEAVLDPLVLLQAVRDDAGVITDFTYLDANQATCDDLSMSREDLLGHGMVALSPGVRVAGTFDVYVRAVESAEPTVVDGFRYDDGGSGPVRFYDIRARVVDGERLSLTWRDVTDRHEVAARIAESESRYRLLAENSTDVVLLDRKGVVEWVSPALETALGWTPAEWTGEQVAQFIHPDDIDAAAPRRREAARGETVVTRVRLRARDGVYHWVEVHAGPFVDDTGRHSGVVASFRVVDSEVAAQAELDRRARFDDLTGVFKRDEALARLDRIARMTQRTGHEWAVVYCDIDDFKTINDTLGHAAGDAVLCVLAQRLRAGIRSDDYVARMGGDEFLVLLDGVHDLDQAVEVAEKLRHAAAQEIPTPAGPVRVTLSIGLTMGRGGEGVDDVVARADQAMYRAKQSGRDRVVAE